jgi:hypothetical protein
MTHYRRVLEIGRSRRLIPISASRAGGDWGRAIGHYREALKAMRPNSADTLNALGDALTMTGDLAH